MTNNCEASSRGTPIHQLGYTSAERAILTIARHYFSSFADPEQQGWLQAISAALDTFGHDTGPHAACAVLSAVQAMRRSRRSSFRYNNANCTCCAGHVSPHERAFLNTIKATARNRPDAAQGHAVLLCEGNDVSRVLMSAQIVADICMDRSPAPLPVGQDHEY
ncbi:hypothetical protein [Chachezhania antarctica]|uniref:hypothetical protein n=1 Tax=Chachezhania antarctica TaxID=2340860 RepID=UPI0019694F7C|nr:hypothetical protein [Chachezhania antarctica]|tara:strand:+ start:101 stop:589 length:489 start_codon:yes stop_codon:yes gene_type:complete